MIFTIFKKELIDTLRDKRTMRTMLLIPLLVFPITLTLFVNVSSSFEKKASEEKLKIGVWGDLGSKYWNQLKEMPDGLGKKESTWTHCPEKRSGISTNKKNHFLNVVI
jgi:sodium transport system permease protein